MVYGLYFTVLVMWWWINRWCRVVVSEPGQDHRSRTGRSTDAATCTEGWSTCRFTCGWYRRRLTRAKTSRAADVSASTEICAQRVARLGPRNYCRAKEIVGDHTNLREDRRRDSSGWGPLRQLPT